MGEDRIPEHPWLRKPLGCGVLEGWSWRVLKDQIPQIFFFFSTDEYTEGLGGKKVIPGDIFHYK